MKQGASAAKYLSVGQFTKAARQCTAFVKEVKLAQDDRIMQTCEMFGQKCYASGAKAHGRQSRPFMSSAHPPSPLQAVDQGIWRASNHLLESAAAVVALTVFFVTPSAHAFADTTDASKRPHVAIVHQQARGATTPLAPQNPLLDLSAGIFGYGNDVAEERDPITPFTLYGTNFKKYLIEQLQGEKIVSRKKGFTVNACVGAVEVTQETPQFQGLPTGDKALYAKNRVCSRKAGHEICAPDDGVEDMRDSRTFPDDVEALRSRLEKSEGQDLKETCRSACEAACTASLDSYGQQVTQESGFALLDRDKARMARSCTRNCSYECGKPGKAFDFVIPYRR